MDKLMSKGERALHTRIIAEKREAYVDARMATCGSCLRGTVEEEAREKYPDLPPEQKARVLTVEPKGSHRGRQYRLSHTGGLQARNKSYHSPGYDAWFETISPQEVAVLDDLRANPFETVKPRVEKAPKPEKAKRARKDVSTSVED